MEVKMKRAEMSVTNGCNGKTALCTGAAEHHYAFLYLGLVAVT